MDRALSDGLLTLYKVKDEAPGQILLQVVWEQHRQRSCAKLCLLSTESFAKLGVALLVTRLDRESLDSRPSSLSKKHMFK